MAAPVGNQGFNVNYLAVLRRALAFYVWGESPTGIQQPIACLNGEGVLTPQYVSTQPTPAAVPSGAMSLIGTDGTSANNVVAPNGLVIPSGQTLTIAAGANLVNNATTAQISLTLAQLQGNYTTPVTLVPAQGAGTLVVIESIVFDLKYGSANFAGGGAVAAYYGTASGPLASATIAATFFTTFTASQIIEVLGALAVSASTTVLNTAVVLTNPTATFTSGTGATGIVNVKYHVVSGLS